MTWVDWLFWVSAAGFIWSIYLIARGDNPLPSDPAKRADELERRWQAQRRAEGASWDEIGEERQMRMALAKLRRIASDKALNNPKGYEKIIEEAKTEQAEYLRTVSGKITALKFLRTAKNLRLSDVLYGDAMAAVDKAEGWDKPWRGGPPKHYDEDRTAAFTDL